LKWSDPDALAPTSAAEFEAGLSERLGRRAFEASPSSNQALEVKWEGDPEHCRVSLQLSRGSELQGTRSIDSPSGDCKALQPALLTVAALLIESRDSEPEQSVETAEPAPEVPKPEPSPATEAAKKKDASPEPAEVEPRILLGLGVQVILGLAPSAELGPALSLSLSPARHVRLGLVAGWFFPRDYQAAPGFSLSHGNAALFGCGMPISGTFSLGACAGASLHRYESRGLALPFPEENLSYMWALGLGLRAEWRIIRRLRWVGNLGAELAPKPLYFYFTPAEGGETAVFRQARLSPTLFTGLSLELP